ncbi:MAG TPA: hypothetical protein VK469_13040 [Candidatus Kapabacteria bacterium]|nr:hypothetical protein [Candidatus Kapabacteria bacterium]
MPCWRLGIKYIMEFKMGSEHEALEQIKKLKYYEKYLCSGKENVLLGAGFDFKQHNIGNYLVENVPFGQCPRGRSEHPRERYFLSRERSERPRGLSFCRRNRFSPR